MKNYRNAALVIIAIAAFLLLLFTPISPIGQVSIKLETPPPPKAVDTLPLCIWMKSPGDYYIGSQKTSSGTVVNDLSRAAAGRALKDERILIEADKSVPYEEFISLVDTLKAKGIYKIGLIRSDSGCDIASE